MMQGLALAPDAEPRGRSPLPARLEPVLALYLRAVGRPPTDAVEPPPLAPSPPTAPPGAPRLVALDVRPVIAGGRDPLADILSALTPLPAGSALAVTAPFRPAPLERLLGGRGHRTQVLALERGAHVLLCLVGGGPPVLDLRDRPAPEPLEAVLTAAASLTPGETLLAVVPRRPELLLPQLERRGLGHALLALPDGSHLVRVSRAREGGG
jgi:uncharacterized protein (DUF2249 family)